MASLFISDATAQPRRDSPIKKRKLDGSLQALEASTYDFSFSSQFDTILNNSADTDLSDPISIENLRRIKEDAQPPWNPEDIDPLRTRRAVEKAFALQTTSQVIRLLEKSDLRDTYHAIKRSYDKFRDAFRYSLQTDGDSVSVSKSEKGEKLLELNIEFSAKRGIDPRINLGESVRVRYDYTYDATLLEFEFSF